MKDKAIGALVGLACGDAVGTTLEFKERGTFTPITDMVGGGPFNLELGQWTDDTSMALCLAHSLLHNKGFEPLDQMNRYCYWKNQGYMSSTGTCFDIGMTIQESLMKFGLNNNPYSGSTSQFSSGNGSLMRLAPIPIFYHRDIKKCVEFAGLSSKTTHGSIECVESCQLFSYLTIKAFSCNSKQEIFQNIQLEINSLKLKPILDGSFISYTYEEINGSGYVIDSLISALWCFYHGENFKEAVLLAANLGNDADTTAAICGQIAGAFFGYENIPLNWRQSITMADDIVEIAHDLYMCLKT